MYLNNAIICHYNIKKIVAVVGFFPGFVRRLYWF